MMALMGQTGGPLCGGMQPLREPSGLDEHPLPAAVLLQQLLLPCAAAAAGSEEDRGGLGVTPLSPSHVPIKRAGWVPGDPSGSGGGPGCTSPYAPHCDARGKEPGEPRPQGKVGFQQRTGSPGGCTFPPQCCRALGCGSNSAAGGTKPKLSFVFQKKIANWLPGD